MAKIRTPEEITRHKDNMDRYMKSERGIETRRKYKEKNIEKIREYQRIYRERHREELLVKSRKKSKEWYLKSKHKAKENQNKLRKKYKDAFLKMYGGCCTCCGETIYDFLTIEHKQGQMKINRRTGLVAYRDATKEYRPDLYEVLCWNCNCAKGKLGYCPHHPPETIRPYEIHKVRKYNYSKELDTLGRRYK